MCSSKCRNLITNRHNNSYKLLKTALKNHKNCHISAKNNFFQKIKKKNYLDRKLRHYIICSWQCSSDRDKRVKQYGIQTGMVNDLNTFWQKLFFWIFFVNLFVYMQKEFWFYLHWFSHNNSSKLLINLKENHTKGHKSGKKTIFQKFEKIIFSCTIQIFCKRFESSRFNG